MKRCVVLLLSALCSIIVYAQKEYDSILKEGKVWRMEYKLVVEPGYGDVYNDEIIMLKGDTLIDEVPFKQMHKKSWRRGEESEPTEWKAIRCYIGEKDGKIYYLEDNPYNPSYRPYLIVMDFSLGIGDDFVYTSTGSGSQIVYAVKTASDTIFSCSDDKRPRRCLSVIEKDIEFYMRSDIWIEGVGAVKTGLTGIFGLYQYGAYPKLLRCEDNGVCIYEAEDVSADIQTVKENHTTGAVTYDLQGRRVLQPQKGGLYIREGRKVVY